MPVKATRIPRGRQGLLWLDKRTPGDRWASDGMPHLASFQQIAGAAGWGKIQGAGARNGV